MSEGEKILRSYITPTARPPLHAQCAAALGWTALQDRGDGLWIGVQPETGLTVEVPQYGRSWCSTGPLCERFKINLTATPNESIAWYAHSYEGDGAQEWASTPCAAIARVVVELHRKKEQ